MDDECNRAICRRYRWQPRPPRPVLWISQQSAKYLLLTDNTAILPCGGSPADQPLKIWRFIYSRILKKKKINKDSYSRAASLLPDMRFPTLKFISPTFKVILELQELEEFFLSEKLVSSNLVENCHQHRTKTCWMRFIAQERPWKECLRQCW